MQSEKDFEIKCSEINLKKIFRIKDLRLNTHHEFNNWENMQKCLNKAISILGYSYFHNTFFEHISVLPKNFAVLNNLEKLFKLLGDFKGILKFTRKHGKSTFSRYSDDYESLRILTSIQMIKHKGNIIMGYNSWPRLELLDHIISFCGDNKNAKILDAGCGSGLNMYMLSKTNPDLIIDGFEFTHARLASCMINMVYEDKINQLFLGDITNIALPDNSYDVVFTNHVLEQLGQKSAEIALKEVVRVSKKGVVLCEPTIHNANMYEKWRMNRLGYCQDLLNLAKKIPNCIVTFYKEDRFRNYPNTSNTLILEKTTE
ncbi:MAG: class I SAM-dependent methyltransferase [Melioribacteraceae bacterium]